MWAKKGSRPTAVKQTRYEWLYMYAAVEPSSGVSVALQAPHVNTGTMNVFLAMLSDELKHDEHAVLIMDQAGWHKAKKLIVPDNITILYLPPYSPELNPVERLWGYMRSHHLSNRVYENYTHLTFPPEHNPRQALDFGVDQEDQVWVGSVIQRKRL